MTRYQDRAHTQLDIKSTRAVKKGKSRARRRGIVISLGCGSIQTLSNQSRGKLNSILHRKHQPRDMDARSGHMGGWIDRCAWYKPHDPLLPHHTAVNQRIRERPSAAVRPCRIRLQDIPSLPRHPHRYRLVSHLASLSFLHLFVAFPLPTYSWLDGALLDAIPYTVSVLQKVTYCTPHSTRACLIPSSTR